MEFAYTVSAHRIAKIADYAQAVFGSRPISPSASGFEQETRTIHGSERRGSSSSRTRASPFCESAADGTGGELLIQTQRKERSMAPIPQRKPTNHRQRKKIGMMTDHGLPDQGSLKPDPNDPASLLASTTALAIGVTSMVGALKGSSAKLEILIQQSQNLQRDLCKSLETVSSAVNNMARGIESLSAGVSHNTGRVGAVCGEYTKLRKHLEWAMDVSMGDVLKKNAKNRTERDQALKELMDQLFESMDKLQENMQKIALRIEKAPVGHEGTTGYDPPQPPTGHLGSPSVTPLTPAPGMILGAGIPPPPAVPPAPMVPPKPMVPPQPPLPVVKFVGYSPAKMGELPMSHPYQESTLPSS